MALTTLEITSSVYGAFLPEIWSDDTQDAVEFTEVLSKLCTTQFEDEMAVGRILHVPHRSNLATQTKTEGISNTVVFNAITQTHQDVTVSTYEYAAVLLNAVVQAQSKYNDRQALSEKMGYALVRGWEVAIANLPQGFTQAVGTYGADSDDSVIRRSWQYLSDAGFLDDTSNQAADAKAAFVFSPGARQSLFAQDRFVSRDFVDKAAIETAKLSNLYGVPVYGSNLLRSPASGQHDNALFHESAIILVRQVKPTPKAQYRIEYNADAMLIFDLFAAVLSQQPTETPTTASAGTGGSELEALGNSGGCLIMGL